MGHFFNMAHCLNKRCLMHYSGNDILVEEPECLRQKFEGQKSPERDSLASGVAKMRLLALIVSTLGPQVTHNFSIS